METNLGWVKLHRKILDSAVWHDDTAFKVFCWCLLRANRKTGKLTTGRDVGSEDCGLKPTTFYHALLRLKKLKMVSLVTRKVTIKFTEVAINNWGFYQHDDNHSDNQVTINRQSNDNPMTLYKNKELRIKKEEVVADKNSNKRKLLLFLNDREFLKEKSDHFNLDITRVEGEIRMCADWWEESGKQLKHPKAALNNWLRKVNPDYHAQIMKKRIERENKITDAPMISQEEREKNLKKVEEIKADFLNKQPMAS